jgi:hypothetical protein
MASRLGLRIEKRLVKKDFPSSALGEVILFLRGQMGGNIRMNFGKGNFRRQKTPTKMIGCEHEIKTIKFFIINDCSTVSK